jgi:hypothetical protein
MPVDTSAWKSCCNSNLTCPRGTLLFPCLCSLSPRLHVSLWTSLLPAPSLSCSLLLLCPFPTPILIPVALGSFSSTPSLICITARTFHPVPQLFLPQPFTPSHRFTFLRCSSDCFSLWLQHFLGWTPCPLSFFDLIAFFSASEFSCFLVLFQEPIFFPASSINLFQLFLPQWSHSSNHSSNPLAFSQYPLHMKQGSDIWTEVRGHMGSKWQDQRSSQKPLISSQCFRCCGS